MDDWLQHVASELEVEPPAADEALLDAARVVAHSVERRATPLTTYLIGLAAAQHGADVTALCSKVERLAKDWKS